MSTLHTKICIVGAGPAGATTSIFLGKENIPHIIIDAASFPRDKICGDGLDMKAITVLNHIDKSILEQEMGIGGNFVASWGFRIINTKGKHTNFVYQSKTEDTPPPYGVCKRLFFDNLLAERANSFKTTSFLQETKVIQVEKVEKKWRLVAKTKNNELLEIICDLLIGADGDHSVVLKNVGERQINRNHYAAGVRQYWQNISDIHEKNLMEIYYPKKFPMSYFWIFPLGNGNANVGYGMLSAVAAKKNYNIREIFTELIKTDAVLANRFKNATPMDSINGWGLPFASLRRKCFGAGWLLVGDAASMVSPTTGEGIGTGMQTGYIAAKFIKRAVDLDCFDETVFKNYDREIYKRMNDDIKLFNISMWFSPKMMGWVMNNLIQLNFFKKMFQKKVAYWVNAAYNKTLEVNVD